MLPFGVVLELGNSADAYCAVAQAQSLSQVKSSQVKMNDGYDIDSINYLGGM